MLNPFPAIEPHLTGMLEVGEGNSLYWECCGDPNGRPAVVIHGGPGSGCTTGLRQLFDPERYRIVLFDQRMCGRSRPLADDPSVDLSSNTTNHLIDDMERLRRHLDIERWLLWGTSWGSTLALAYAERHPDRTSAIVLAGVTTTRRSEIEWLYGGLRRFFPEEHERFLACARGAGVDTTTATSQEVIAAFGTLLSHPVPEVREGAARAWAAWEDATISLEAEGDPGAYSRRPPEQLLARARICAHFFAHGAWLEEGELLARTDALAGIPGYLVHGRMDMGGIDTAWELAHAWPSATLRLVDRAGHSGSEAMTTLMITVLNHLVDG